MKFEAQALKFLALGNSSRERKTPAMLNPDHTELHINSNQVQMKTAIRTSCALTEVGKSAVDIHKRLNSSPPEDRLAIPEQEVRDALSRILDSSIFAQSYRLARFLRFTVERTLEGDARTLKEYLIGTEVYERKPSYHPSEDSIVRSEARRLRSKLKEYYESAGKDDLVFIQYRPGSYVPLFRQRAQDRDHTVTAATARFSKRHGIAVAVLPFADVSRSRRELSGICAQIVTDELIHKLVRIEGFRVSAVSSVRPLVAQSLDIPSVARKLDVQIVFEGTVHEDNNQLRITSRVVDADGFLICSERFETEPDNPSFFKVSKKIASALIRRVWPQKSSSVKDGCRKWRRNANHGYSRRPGRTICKTSAG